MKRALLVGLVVLYLLHDDFWWQSDGRLLFGLPIGLLYQLIYCLVAAGWMALAVRQRWGGGEEDER